ncbi:DUF3291 domain-containing protein [Bacillus sp. JJ664]
MFISVTRLHLRGKRKLPLFFLHTFQSNQQLKKAEGLIHSSVRNEDLLTYWTLTVWENKEFMKKYRNNGNHLKAMKISRNIADELEKINWEVENEKIPNWMECMEQLHQHYGR